MEPISQLAITSLKVDESLQPRTDGLDDTHIQTLAEAPDAWPPLSVVIVNGAYVLLDGFHRYAAARQLGLESVPVRFIDPPPDGDLRGLAFLLNARHGRPLSLADRRAEAGRILKRNREYADRVVARAVGLSPTTVASVRREIATPTTAHPPTRVGADGYRRPMHAGPAPRKPGELPSSGVISQLGDLFAPREQARNRRIVRYLQQLATALDDQFELDGWVVDDDAIDACRAILGEQRSEALAKRLGPAVSNVLEVAIGLGYDPDAPDDGEDRD